MTFVSVSGVFGKSLCINRSLVILIISASCILHIVGLFSPTSSKNLANCLDCGLFPFLITCMFIDKVSFIAEFHISGYIISGYDLTTTDHDAFGVTGNVCRGSSQNITIFPPRKLSLLVISFSILLTANTLYVCVIKALSHIFIMRNSMLMFT